jgi:hypothetical protein
MNEQLKTGLYVAGAGASIVALILYLRSRRSAAAADPAAVLPSPADYAPGSYSWGGSGFSGLEGGGLTSGTGGTGAGSNPAPAAAFNPTAESFTSVPATPTTIDSSIGWSLVNGQLVYTGNNTQGLSADTTAPAAIQDTGVTAPGMTATATRDASGTTAPDTSSNPRIAAQTAGRTAQINAAPTTAALLPVVSAPGPSAPRAGSTISSGRSGTATAPAPVAAPAPAPAPPPPRRFSRN